MVSARVFRGDEALAPDSCTVPPSTPRRAPTPAAAARKGAAIKTDGIVYDGTGQALPHRQPEIAPPAKEPRSSPG